MGVLGCDLITYYSLQSRVTCAILVIVVEKYKWRKSTLFNCGSCSLFQSSIMAQSPSVTAGSNTNVTDTMDSTTKTVKTRPPCSPSAVEGFAPETSAYRTLHRATPMILPVFFKKSCRGWLRGAQVLSQSNSNNFWFQRVEDLRRHERM